MRSPRPLSVAVACTAVTVLCAPVATAADTHALRPPLLRSAGVDGEGRPGVVGEGRSAAGVYEYGAPEPGFAAGPDVPGPDAGDLDGAEPGVADEVPLDGEASAAPEAESSERGTLGEPDGAEASAEPADPGGSGDPRELDDPGELDDPDELDVLDEPGATTPSEDSTADTAVPGDVPESPVRRGESERPAPEDLRGVHAGEGAEARRSVPLLALGGALVAGAVLAAGWFAVRRPREF